MKPKIPSSVHSTWWYSLRNSIYLWNLFTKSAICRHNKYTNCFTMFVKNMLDDTCAFYFHIKHFFIFFIVYLSPFSSLFFASVSYFCLHLHPIEVRICLLVCILFGSIQCIRGRALYCYIYHFLWTCVLCRCTTTIYMIQTVFI